LLQPRLQLRRLLHCGADERGQALVEFALLLPLLLIVVLGMLDIGKAVSYWQDETHLANEAARYAVVDRAPPGYSGANAIRDGVIASASTHELKNGGSSIKTPLAITFCHSGTGQVANSDYVKVTVTATYHWLNFLASKLSILPNKVITATATMRLEHDYDGSVYTASQCT
jgi:Flp pilus assembly protein TadG